jgi:hypothetical protein|tara:strand:+ start:79 stop:381 length:303 start_codon:yes stop_codon:yes gene_type:complete
MSRFKITECNSHVERTAGDYYVIRILTPQLNLVSPMFKQLDTAENCLASIREPPSIVLRIKNKVSIPITSMRHKCRVIKNRKRMIDIKKYHKALRETTLK